MNNVTYCLLPVLINCACFTASVLTVNFYVMFALVFLMGFCIALPLTGLLGDMSSVVCNFHFATAVVIEEVTAGFSSQLAGVLSGKPHFLKFRQFLYNNLNSI